MDKPTKKLADTRVLKAQAKEQAQQVQASVKLELQDWIKNGVVVDQLKIIIENPDTKQSERLKAIELLTKLSGFEVESVKTATTATSQDVGLWNADFEELKVIWVNEIKRGLDIPLKDNLTFLTSATEDELEAFVLEANTDI
jgi:hypothetical protein